jgi:hypothetical protein
MTAMMALDTPAFASAINPSADVSNVLFGALLIASAMSWSENPAAFNFITSTFVNGFGFDSAAAAVTGAVVGFPVLSAWAAGGLLLAGLAGALDWAKAGVERTRKATNASAEANRMRMVGSFEIGEARSL